METMAREPKNVRFSLSEAPPTARNAVRFSAKVSDETRSATFVLRKADAQVWAKRIRDIGLDPSELLPNDIFRRDKVIPPDECRDVAARMATAWRLLGGDKGAIWKTASHRFATLTGLKQQYWLLLVFRFGIDSLDGVAIADK